MPRSTLEKRVTELEQQLAVLQKSRPGRKTKPIIVSEAGVCGINPDIDSALCDDASIYRYQSGCRGIACAQRNRNYYADYRQKNKGDVEAE
jgi:hypothetical protein